MRMGFGVGRGMGVCWEGKRLREDGGWWGGVMWSEIGIEFFGEGGVRMMGEI